MGDMDNLTLAKLADPDITDERIGQTFSSMVDLLLMPPKKKMTLVNLVKMFKMRMAITLATSLTAKITPEKFNDEFTFSVSFSTMCLNVFSFGDIHDMPGVPVFIERMIHECFSSLSVPRVVKDIQWSLRDCIITVHAVNFSETD